MEQEIKKLHNELDTIVQEKQELQNQVMQLDQEIDTLTKTIKENQEQNQALQKQVLKLEQENDILEQELVAMLKRLKVIFEKLEKIKKYE